MKSNKRTIMAAALKGCLTMGAAGWLFLGTGNACLAQTPAASLSPDLQEVVKLSQQKMSDDIITSYIKNTGHSYKLGADDIIYLNGQGVSQAVIAALLATSQGAPAAGGGAAPSPTPSAAPDAGTTPQPPPLDPSAGAGPAAPAPAAPAPSAPGPGAPGSPAAPSAPPMSAPAPAAFQDNFFADATLNPSLWLTQSSLLSGLAVLNGRPVWTSLAFSPSGMQMSGTHGSGQFVGIQSTASFVAPFNFSATVTGLAQDAIPFEVYLVSADLQQWVSVAGHLGGRGERGGAVDVGGGFGHVFGGVRIPLGKERSPDYGVWVNHTGSGLPISSLGYKMFEEALAGVPYTIQINVGPDGGAAVSLLDAGRGLIATQTVPVGQGPFYIVLAGRNGDTIANWQAVQAVSTVPAPPVAQAAPAIPPVPTMDYFQSQLAPYGSWVTVAPYGLVWQPAVGPGWRPYVDGGSWTYTDAGWYWQSDYPWGDLPFHYGRWAYTYNGWVWVPGYDYAPAWVVWRHDDVDGYVGWAPLPYGAVFVDGGWRYNGVAVGMDFDFGVGAGFFCFVDGGHFWDHDFRRYAVPHDRLVFVFGHSTFENHYRFDHGHFVNVGIDRDRMARLTHRDVRDFQTRRLEDVRHDEERRNAVARRDDIRAFRPGEHPSAIRAGAAHRDFERAADRPGDRALDRPGAEHPAASYGHDTYPGHAPTGQPGARPQSGHPQTPQQGQEQKKPN